jgi:hypothetical protein
MKLSFVKEVAVDKFEFPSKPLIIKIEPEFKMTQYLPLTESVLYRQSAMPHLFYGS